MLVLSRKKNQTIRIDDRIEIEVLQTKGGVVKLGIRAPKDVRIVRGELNVYPEFDSVPLSQRAAESVDSAAACADSVRNKAASEARGNRQSKKFSNQRDESTVRESRLSLFDLDDSATVQCSTSPRMAK